MISVLASQLRNVKVDNIFFNFDLGHGSAWEPEERFLWEQKGNTFSEPQSAF